MLKNRPNFPQLFRALRGAGDTGLGGKGRTGGGEHLTKIPIPDADAVWLR